MRSVFKLGRAIRQSRCDAVKSGLSIALGRQVGVRSSFSGVSNSRRYVQSAALIRDSDQDRPPTTSRQFEGAPGVAPLESLVEDIREAIEKDVGGRDIWSQRLERVMLDLEAPRRKRIGGVWRVTSVIVKLTDKSSATSWQCQARWSRLYCKIRSASRRHRALPCCLVASPHQDQRLKLRECASLRTRVSCKLTIIQI